MKLLKAAIFLLLILLPVLLTTVFFSKPVSAQTTPVSCTPRPNIGRTTSMGSNGLTVTLTPSGTNNPISEIKFTKFDNGVINLNQEVITDVYTYHVPSGSQSTTFVIKQLTVGKPTTISLSAKDGCGDYPLFFGGGINAGWPGTPNPQITIKTYQDLNCSATFDQNEPAEIGSQFLIGDASSYLPNDPLSKSIFTDGQGLAVYSDLVANKPYQLLFFPSSSGRTTTNEGVRFFTPKINEKLTFEFGITNYKSGVSGCSSTLTVSQQNATAGDTVSVSWKNINKGTADTKLQYNQIVRTTGHIQSEIRDFVYAGTCTKTKGEAPKIAGFCQFKTKESDRGTYFFDLTPDLASSNWFEVKRSSVLGFVYTDNNCDGVFNYDEKALAGGLKVKLVDEANSQFLYETSVEQNATYAFWNVDPMKQYKIVLSLPAGTDGTITSTHDHIAVDNNGDKNLPLGVVFYDKYENSACATSKGDLRFRIAEFNGNNFTGKYLNDVKVKLFRPQGGGMEITKMSFKSGNEDGWVWFDGLPPGTYEVMAFKDGYKGVWKMDGCEGNGTFTNASISDGRTEGHVAAWDNEIEVKAKSVTVCQDLGLSTGSVQEIGNLRFRISEFQDHVWTGGFLNDVTVKLTDQSGNTVTKTEKSRKLINGEDGWVWFDDMPAGSYGILAYKEGYEGIWKQVDCQTPGGNYSNATIQNANTEGKIAAWDDTVQIVAGQVTVCQDLGLKTTTISTNQVQSLNIVETSTTNSTTVTTTTTPIPTATPIASPSSIPSSTPVPTPTPSVSPSMTPQPSVSSTPIVVSTENSTSSAVVNH